MTRTFTEFAGILAKRQPTGRALLVAIDGYGGSGKSTFTALLHGALKRAGVTPVTTVDADGFVMNLWEEDWRPFPSMPGESAPYRIDRDPEVGIPVFTVVNREAPYRIDVDLECSQAWEAGLLRGAPYRIDVDRLRREVLAPLRSGVSAQFVHRDWWDRKRPEVRIVPSRGIVLVAGTYTLDRRLRDCYDERIFIECPEEMALERALARDMPLGDDPVGELAWKEVHHPANRAYISDQHPRAAAQVVVDSAQPMGPETFVTLDEGSGERGSVKGNPW